MLPGLDQSNPVKIPKESLWISRLRKGNGGDASVGKPPVRSGTATGSRACERHSQIKKLFTGCCCVFECERWIEVFDGVESFIIHADAYVKIVYNLCGSINRAEPATFFPVGERLLE